MSRRLCRQDLTVDYGRIADVEDFVNLLDISAGEFMRALFGPNMRQTVSFLYSYGNTIFGVQSVVFARLHGENIGMYTGYAPWRSALTYLRTGWVLLRHLRRTTSPRLSRMIAGAKMSIFPPRTFYLSNIAVYYEYRGMGIGKLLMEYLEKTLEEKGMKRIVLDVETSNSDAISFYSQLGYRRAKKSRVIKVSRKRFEFFRMEKRIGQH